MKHPSIVGTFIVAGMLTAGVSCSPPSEDAITSACDTYAYTFCTALQGCSATELQIRYVDLGTCRSILTTVCVDAATQPSSARTPSTLAACVSAIQTSWPCSDLIHVENIPPACAPVGPRSNGASCAVAPQCESGACTDPNGLLCGTCGPAPKPGDPCTEVSCGLGMECAQGVCVAYAESGAACSNTQPCDEGLTCVGAVCQPGVSMAGAACTFGGAGCDLYSDLACNALTNTCAVAKLSTPGEACGLVDNQMAYCVGGFCSRGVCVASSDIGGPCDINTGDSCLGGLHCVTTDGGTAGTCQALGSATCP